jgi:hypothetical protein
MAKKLAQLAADRELATNMRVSHITELACVASQAHLKQTHEMEDALTSLKEQLAELESRLADSDSLILPLEAHCPPNFTKNIGLVLDFYIYEDGMRLLARYVCRIPGTNIAQDSNSSETGGYPPTYSTTTTPTSNWRRYKPYSACKLQAEADTLTMQQRAAHYQLARANAGIRLVAVEAISPFHQEGSAEGCSHRGKTRGWVFGK